jgi:uncharacterized protein (TIGR03083 family)
MQLTPRYGSHPVLHLDGDPSAIGALVIRQSRRFVAALASLNDEQWEHPSRCEGWSSRDVTLHLATAVAFWEMSIRAGLAGQPTEIMAAFDPVATPQQMVADSPLSPDEVVELLAASTESLAACLDELTPTDWTLLAEAPPGHVTMSAVLHHALWDSWIHERDVLLPLGMSPVEEPDEVLAALRYVAGLTSALVLTGGGTRSGAFDVSATDPDASIHVEIGRDVSVTGDAIGADFVLTGRSVDLLEALSIRRPLDHDVPDEIAWAFAGLSTAFDQ